MEHDTGCERFVVVNELRHGNRGFTLSRDEADRIRSRGFEFSIACNCAVRKLGMGVRLSRESLVHRTYEYLMDARRAAEARRRGEIGVSGKGMDNRTRRELEKSSANVIRVDFRNRRRAD